MTGEWKRRRFVPLIGVKGSRRPKVLRAVVASRDGHGVVLWADSVLRSYIQEIGSGLDDVGLDNAPDGLSVWVGNISAWQEPTGEYNSDLKGTFNRLTEKEWTALAAGRKPWRGAK